MKFILSPKVLLVANILFMIFHVVMFVTEGSNLPWIWAALGIVSIVALTMETNAAKKIVLGNGLGYLVMTGAFLYYRFFDNAVAYGNRDLPPDGGLVLWGVLTVWMLVEGFKKDGGEEEFQEEAS